MGFYYYWAFGEVKGETMQFCPVKYGAHWGHSCVDGYRSLMLLCTDRSSFDLGKDDLVKYQLPRKLVPLFESVVGRWHRAKMLFCADYFDGDEFTNISPKLLIETIAVRICNALSRPVSEKDVMNSVASEARKHFDFDEECEEELGKIIAANDDEQRNTEVKEVEGVVSEEEQWYWLCEDAGGDGKHEKFSLELGSDKEHWVYCNDSYSALVLLCDNEHGSVDATRGVPKIVQTLIDSLEGWWYGKRISFVGECTNGAECEVVDITAKVLVAVKLVKLLFDHEVERNDVLSMLMKHFQEADSGLSEECVAEMLKIANMKFFVKLTTAHSSDVGNLFDTT